MEICILVMDYDPACVNIVAEMVPNCTHKVLHFDEITNALNAICKSKDKLKFVLTNVQRSDANRFEIIQHIEKEFKLPIISISSDGNKKTVPRGVESGIMLYFVKSLSMNNVNTLRHFPYVRERGKLVAPEIEASAQTTSAIDQAGTKNASFVGEATGGYQKRKRIELKRTTEISVGEATGGYQKRERIELKRTTEISAGEATGGYQKRKRIELKRTTEKSEDCPNDYPREKKQRVVWTAEMHLKFLEAIQQLGLERAFPKKIVEVMDVHGLTRENVASHLQKYRMCLKRSQEAMHSTGSNYGINLSTDVKGTCFPSSYPLPNLYSSQGSSPYPMQRTNLTPLQQGSNFAISMTPTNSSCFITNPEASTPMSNLVHQQQSLPVSNQQNLHYSYTYNVSSVQAMPSKNTNYLEFATSQPICQIGSTQVESKHVPNIPVNDNFRLYGDNTKNILFSIDNSMSSKGTNHLCTSSNTYVGYRLTRNGNSVEFGQMGALGNDEMIRRENLLSAEGNLVNESSVHALRPLLQLQHDLDSFGDEADLDVLLNATESTSPQWLWDDDFVDALFNHSD